VDVLFTRPSAACPECGTPLRRSDFRVQQFEDLIVEKEVDVRKRIIKMYIILYEYIFIVQ
jgi:CDK-activating kinase assembly factor MAT1